MKIGVFDSGIGGVTVLKEMRQVFPGADFAYFGDTANVPYGTKSAHQILALSQSAANRLRAHRLDALIIACNTASSLALPEFERILAPMPVVGVVTAGVESVRQRLPQPKGNTRPVVIFGTRATVNSHVYLRLLTASAPTLSVQEQACPLLVPMIEEGWVEHPILRTTLREYTQPYAKLPPGVALLACTHYPWIRRAFEAELPGWAIVDSAEAVALAARTRLGTPPASGTTGKLEWYFSDPEGVADFVFEGPRPAKLATF
ncbi:MAG: glutamate racemase [Bacteriovoracia bacterium]